MMFLLPPAAVRHGNNRMLRIIIFSLNETVLEMATHKKRHLSAYDFASPSPKRARLVVNLHREIELLVESERVRASTYIFVKQKATIYI